MRTSPPTCLRALRDLADELDLVFIVDEDCHRLRHTGKSFASESAVWYRT
ncbi:hypothetical protein QJS66_16755 [Kocuria rhizophila]|nr:hypothetical protein QJS66_16755 [Kocuria rhizophila]